jgi:hypothetical protein
MEYALDLILQQMTVVVDDGGAIRLAGCLVSSGDIENTIGVDIMGDLDLRDTRRCKRIPENLDLQKDVVPSACTLTSVDLGGHCGLLFEHVEYVLAFLAGTVVLHFLGALMTLPEILIRSDNGAILRTCVFSDVWDGRLCIFFH